MSNINDQIRACVFSSFRAGIIGQSPIDRVHMFVDRQGAFVLGLVHGQEIKDLQIQSDDITLHVHGELKPDVPSHVQERLFSEYFPNCDYQKLGIFMPVSFRTVSSGESVISSEDIHLHNNFADDVVSRMVEHMNEDHVDALNDYCGLFNISRENDSAKMLTVDQYGFDIIVNERPHRIMFEAHCHSPQCVREQLVELAKKARQPH